jgi:hypothetical protein
MPGLALSGVDIDVEGMGDIVLMPGVPGSIIKVFRILLTFADGSPTVTFKSGSTKLPGTFHMQDGGSIALGMERRRWAECGEGEDFVINLSEHAKVGGALTVWVG